MRLAIGNSYTAQSATIADEECINWYSQTIESEGPVVPVEAYGGRSAGQVNVCIATPGLVVFAALPGVPRGQCWTGSRLFAVAGTQLVELTANGTQINRGFIATDGNAASLAFNGFQVLIVSGGRAYCYTLDANKLIEVTAQLAGVPVKVECSDTYFIVFFQNSNKFQLSQLLDGTTWPGQLVNEVSVFAENITSIICNHRELWVFGQQRSQVYDDTGSTEAFDPVPGALIEKGCWAAFAPSLLDNSVFWIDQDQRGGLSAWRSNGYTPTRVSTYAQESDLASYGPAQIAGIVTYSYQRIGHLFWVIYIPGAKWSWVFDVTEGKWHKRNAWISATSTAQSHWSWNHSYAFGKHLVGDWNSSNLYEMNEKYLTDNGTNIRCVMRLPIMIDEMQRLFQSNLTLDFDTGEGPQPPLTDGLGNPRQPQVMLRWSNDRGRNWSNEHLLNLGFAGQYRTRAIQRRIGQSRYRVIEFSISDPVQRTLLGVYLNTAEGQ